MASKQVQDILIKLGIQGFEGLDKLKSSFRGLEKAIGPTDSAIQSARQSIIDFTGSGKQSIQSIQGQIDAFKGLQAQATIGGNVYRQLAGDVNRLSDTLKSLKNDYEEVGRAAKQTDKQIAAQFPARKPEAFRQQLAALNRQLDQLSVSGREYAEVLTEITIRETAFGRAQSRQRVIAGAEAVGAPLIGAMQPKQQLPNTLAALQLRISELSQDFQNLDRASQPYQDTLAEINRLQNELSRATEDGNADRKEEIRARIENYRQITAENTALREQAAIRRSVERGRARAAGQRVIEQPMRQISGLYQQIGQIGMQPILGDIEMMGNSYTRVSNDIKRATNASNNSIQSLQAQRGAWQALRAQIDPTSNDFRQASKEIEQLDRRLGKLQQTQSRRMSGMQMAQAAGAAISGGIFGGPEGFLGGAIGGITAGVGGAFVGAAAGAQVGMLRQQLGGFADYAAQIQKMEIALKSAAGSQDQFNQAVAAANSVVRNLNVPQDVAIQGMTRLTAAVKGAGGQVSDAELVFKNVTSAIKATGGSAEDVDGAITAMVQVFSKGKVSAEELSGQLGERLPGAVTKFAKANDMTLPELQKALEQGQVGLNELMNFIVQLGDEYSGVAQQIAGSSQDAGARLTVAFNDMRIAVGETLQPIGAAFQEAFIPFIEGITPVLVDVLPKIGKLALALAKNFDTLAVSAAAALGVFAVGKIAAIGGVGAALLQLAAAAGTATVSLKALNAAALLNPWTALAAGVAAVAVAFYDARKEKQRLDEVMESGSLDQLDAEIKRLEKSIADSESKARGYASELRGVGQESGYANIELRKTKELLESFKAEYRVRFFIEQTFAGAKGVPQGMRVINGQLAYQVPGQGWVNAQTGEPIKQAAATQFPSLSGGDSGGRAAKSAADKAAREEQRIQERLRNLAIETESIIRQALFKGKIAEAEIAGNKELAIRLRGEARAQQISQELERSLIGITDERVKQALLVKSQAEIESAGIDTAIELEQQRLAVIKEQNDELFKRAGFTPQDKMREGAGAFDLSLPDLRVSPAESQMNKYREELEALSNPISMAVTGANAIGDAFGQAFQSIVTGSQSTQQALSNAFKAIGEAFIQMATEIIAKQIAMITFQTILRALGGSSSFGFSGAGPAQLPGGAGFAQGFSMPSLLASAKGNAFAQNGIQPFANGGIVTKPTFFKYANGGTFNNGVMGEAGPEAIMPLKRGPDGRLGISMYAASRQAVADAESMVGAGAATYEEESISDSSGYAGGLSRGALAAAQAVNATRMEVMQQQSISERRSEMRYLEQVMAKPTKLDIKYESQVINSVEYVTREQAERMAAQSALRGRELAIGSLQNSVKTRKRVGIA